MIKKLLQIDTDTEFAPSNSELGVSELARNVFTTTLTRITQAINGPDPARGKHIARRDFDLPPSPSLKRPYRMISPSHDDDERFYDKPPGLVSDGNDSDCYSDSC